MLNHVEIIPNSFNQYEPYYYISYLVDKKLIIFDHVPMLTGLISDSTHRTPWKRDRIAKWSLFSTWWSSTCQIFCGKTPFYFAGRSPMDFTGGFPACRESCWLRRSCRTSAVPLRRPSSRPAWPRCVRWVRHGPGKGSSWDLPNKNWRKGGSWSW